MFCPNCGGSANDTARFCEHCGKQLRPGSTLVKGSGESVAATCRWCGLPLANGDTICRYCFRDNAQNKEGRGLRAILIAGGIIVIIAGVLSLGATAWLMFTDSDSYVQDPTGYVPYILLEICAIMAIVLGFMPLWRRHYRLSVAGGIFSLLGGAFFIGIFGLLLILLGRKAFKD